MRITLLLLPALLWAQTEPERLTPLLKTPLTSPDVVAQEMRQYLIGAARPSAAPKSAAEWSAESARLRREFFEKVVFRGWPAEWINAPLKSEDLGDSGGGPGYRMRKLRFEILPGFWTSGVLYLPDPLPARAPAVINFNGHVGPLGKSVEYKQKRCINQARMGMIALNLEWIGYGELTHNENEHWYAGHLDLAGANGLGAFYLAARKGLDYLAQHARVDAGRIGVTGLSGGGWQTILLSALDERVSVAIPVAGYAPFVSRVERAADIGDLEQNATDSQTVLDYTHLTAMRAPKPTLLIYNAEDDCCFRAPLVKELLFDRIRPVFALFGRQDQLAWHENLDPADHNYQLDNRQASYAFLARHFELNPTTKESPAGAELRTAEELTAGLPAGNLTLLGVAKQLLDRNKQAAGNREQLRDTVRFREVSMRHAWALDNSKGKGLETRSYRFQFSNGLSATGVLIQSMDAPPKQATLVLHDRGRAAAAGIISDRVNREEAVLAADLLFTGDAAPRNPSTWRWAQLFAAAGDRPLGIEAAQLSALVEWLRATTGVERVRLEVTGIRMQLVAWVAAALHPMRFAEVVVHDGLGSLRQLFDKPVPYRDAPDLFCFGLLNRFDIGDLERLSRGR